MIVVGICSTCGGKVFYFPARHYASCADHCSVIPRAFLAPRLRP